MRCKTAEINSDMNKNTDINMLNTPFYVFDMNILEERTDYLRKKFEGVAGICYAIKANTFIVRDIENHVDRFEVCSPGEMEICRDLDIDMKKVVVSGVNKEEKKIREYIREIRDVGLYTVESEKHYSILKKAAEDENVTVSVLLRLTSGTQFGMDEDVLEKVLTDAMESENIHVAGIQFFSGTQKTSLKKLKKEVEYVDAYICSLAEKYGYAAEEMEFGPGLPVEYFHNENGKKFDEDAFLDEFRKILMDVRCGAEITLELGRSIAASCGTYGTSVVDVKTCRGLRYAIADGGIHQIAYYGQFMATRIPEMNILRRNGEKYEELPLDMNADAKEGWNVCGSLCTINDILVKALPVAELAEGDLFLFRNAGAYCATEGISTFLSRDMPEIYIKETGGNIRKVRDRFETFLLNEPGRWLG